MRYTLVAALLLLVAKNAIADEGVITIPPGAGYIFYGHQVNRGSAPKRDVWWKNNQLICESGYAAGPMPTLDAFTHVDASKLIRCRRSNRAAPSRCAGSTSKP